jgi:hypothetical protein
VQGISSNDWGSWKSTTLDLDRIQSALPSYALSDPQRELVKRRILLIRQTIEGTPKSLHWSISAKLGEKVRWYELSEADNILVYDNQFKVTAAYASNT